jgi:hypothetical protein
MRFLLTGNVAAAVGEAVVRHGHQVVAIDSLGVNEQSTREELLRAADKAQLDIITADAELADTPYALDLHFHRAIIFLQLSGGEVEQDDAIDRLFERYTAPKPKRLYTITENRVKVRQLPGN